MTQLDTSDVFLQLIVAFLTPIFLTTTGGDLNTARAASLSTVHAYAARNPTDLLPIALVIALGLAALSSITLSMTDNLSVPLILRLRGNALSLTRTGEQYRRALSLNARPEPSTVDSESARQHEDAAIATIAHAEQRLSELQVSVQTADQGPATPVAATSNHAEAATPQPTHATPEPATPKTLPAAVGDACQRRQDRNDTATSATPRFGFGQTLDGPTLSPQDRVLGYAWAAAMTRVARECTTDLAVLSPSRRREATLRATALSSVARDLLADVPPPPAFIAKPGHP